MTVTSPQERNQVQSQAKSGLFFLHIPKTAGTSLVGSIKAYLSIAAPLDYNLPDLEARLDRSEFVWGHVSLDAFRQLPNSDRFRTAVVIRDPFARLASHLQFTDRYNEPKFVKDTEKLPEAVKHAVREIAKVDFEDAGAVAAYLASPSPWGQAAFDNCQVQFLTDTPRPPDYLPRKRVTEAQIGNAVARLEDFDFLAVTEDISHCVAQIAATYRHRPSAPPTLNVGNHGRRVNWRDPAIRKAMSPLVRGDVAVYRRAKELVERRRAAASAA
jgi:hypothetical protein